MPKISIIMPVYNTGEQLYKTLMSVMGQLEKDFEVLMVDDGSDDALTLETEETFARFDSRFKLHKMEQNSGAASCRNFGIEHATGEYLIFLDSDDLFCNDLLSEMADTLDESGADICVSNFMMLDIVNNVKSPIYAKIKNGVTDRVFSLNELGDDGLSYWMPMQGNKMLRRDFVSDNNLRYQLIKNCEDMFFGYMSVIRAKKIVYCRKSDPLMIYRVNNPKQLSYVVDSRNAVKAFESLLEIAKEDSNEEAIRQLLTEMEATLEPMISRCRNEEYNAESRKEAAKLIEQYGS